MTEKRFKHKWNKLGMQFICYDDKAELLGTFADDIGVTNIVELLNELHEENEQLKQQCKDFMEMLDDMCIAYLVNDGLEVILND